MDKVNYKGIEYEIPEECRDWKELYIAVDDNGEVWAYSCEPDTDEYAWNNEEEREQIYPAEQCYWKDSLEKIR